MGLADLRREYNLAGLRRADLAADPIVQFQRWFEQASGKHVNARAWKFLIRLYKKFLLGAGQEPMEENAMVLSTANKQGHPSARVVLLKGLDERGFIFYTNYESRKGRELAENANASLLFYWSSLEREVTIAGEVSKLSQEESTAYYNRRPHGSRIGAWASRQSQPVPNRLALEKQWRHFEDEYPSQVPKPPFWGGYVLRPVRIEFWQGRPNRLHDRFRYTRQADNTWKIERLSP